MTFPIFPKLWNGPTALGESRAQAQVPGLPFQTTLAGNTEMRRSGDFVDVYQKKSQGLFVTWGQLDKGGDNDFFIQYPSGDPRQTFAMYPGEVAGNLDQSFPDPWMPTVIFQNYATTFLAVSPTAKGGFAPRAELKLNKLPLDAIIRGPAGNLIAIEGGETFAPRPPLEPVDFRIPGNNQEELIRVSASTDGRNFSELFSVFTSTDVFSTGYGFNDSVSESTRGNIDPFSRSQDRPWLISRPLGARTADGWTVGIGHRRAQGNGASALYTSFDSVSGVRTVTIATYETNHGCSVPRITRVAPTTLVAVFADYGAVMRQERSYLQVRVSNDNGATWRPLDIQPYLTPLDPPPDSIFYTPPTPGYKNFAAFAVRASTAVPLDSGRFTLLVFNGANATNFSFDVSGYGYTKLTVGIKDLETSAVRISRADTDGTIANTLINGIIANQRPLYAMFDKASAPTYVFMNRRNFLNPKIFLTNDFQNFEEITLPVNVQFTGEPRWLTDTHVILPMWDGEYSLYESTDQMRTWSKRATIWESVENLPALPVNPRFWLAGAEKFLPAFSTVECIRDANGAMAPANPFSGRWICDGSVTPPDLLDHA